jgi:hypothetical protein
MEKAGYTIKLEEYSPLGDFIQPSFTRDKSVFLSHFTKFNEEFANKFTEKLAFVKELESTFQLSEQQKETTKSLYLQAAKLSDDLNFTSLYFKDAGLSTAAITAIKKDINNHNIEGALLKTESLKQYIVANQQALEEQGMPNIFPDKLSNYLVDLAKKNKDQSEFMKAHKELTDANMVHYVELYSYISQIAQKGKVIFKNTVYADEYNISKYLKKMRASKKAAPNTPPTP